MIPRVVAIGPLPPPVHGYSLITSLVIERLRRTAGVEVFDVSSGKLVRGWRYHWTRLRRVLSALTKLVLRRPQGDALYLAIAGGAGITYDIAFAALGRWRGYRLFIHHHSFGYIDRRGRCAAALIAIAGANATHVCLCPTMAERLAQQYARVRRTLVLSNAALIAPTQERPRRRSGGHLSLGFISNLIPEKGLDIAVEVLQRLHEMESDVALIVAGPALDPGTQRFLADAGRRFGNALDYRGAVYDAAKLAFFRDVDVLLFPTRYANEAQPLVVFEAMGHGIPVIATGRGCIPEDLVAGGMVVFPEDDFVAAAVTTVRGWLSDPGKLNALAAAAAARANEMFGAAQCDLERIVARLTRSDEI